MTSTGSAASASGPVGFSEEGTEAKVARLASLGSRIASLSPRVAVPGKRADAFYLSPEWRALVKRIKAERGPYCERCGSGHRVAGDHVVEIKDGGAPLDAANVELLCQRHHNRKTAAARAKRAGLA